MNRKELIKLLDKYEIEYKITDNTKEVEEGLRLFDEALKKIGIVIPKETRVDNIIRENDSEVPKYTSDSISRQATIRAICQECAQGGYDECSVDCLEAEILRKLPSIGLTSAHEDAISRVDAIHAMCKECKLYGECVVDCVDVVVIKNMPPVEPKPVCEDCIDRYAVLAELDPKSYEYKVVKKLPSVEPKQSELHIDEPRGYTLKMDKAEAYSERPKGQWIPVRKVYRTSEADFPNIYIEWETATDPDDIDAVRCSTCGEVFDFEDARNWCTECGADMRGADDETD